MDTVSLAMGLAVCLAVGGLLTGLLVSSRLRGQVQSRLIESAERAQRAACEAAELRKQGELDRAELSHVRETLAAASHAQAVAETRVEETAKHLEEQKSLLAQARLELTETFKALSWDALKTNNEAFLSLAKSSFETLRAEANGELSQRQQPIDELVKPLHGALHR